MKKAEHPRKVSVLTVLLFCVLILSVCSTVGLTFAKYTAAKGSRGTAIAEPFFFSSDLLESGETIPYYQVEEPKEGETIDFSFQVKNYMDSLRVNGEDISYTCRAENAKQDVLNGPAGGTIPGGAPKADTVTFTLDKDDFLKTDGTPGEILFTVETQSPYEKILQLQVGYHEAPGKLQWSIAQNTETVTLYLTGEGEVSVTWLDGLQPETSGEIFTLVEDFAFTAELEPSRRYAVTFFKQVPGTTFSQQDFSVTQN